VINREGKGVPHREMGEGGREEIQRSTEIRTKRKRSEIFWELPNLSSKPIT
jgi:hypothetical protein